MKFPRQFIYTLTVLIAVSALYRLIPGRPPGFAPQLAMGLLGTALFRHDKKWGFALPLFSMLLSDLGMEILFRAGYTAYSGFYGGQWLNYMMILAVSTLGFGINKPSAVSKIAVASVASPLLYFWLSNSSVWLGGGGFHRGFSFAGYIQTLADGLPFLYTSILATIVFSSLLFGSWAVMTERRLLEVHS